MDHKKIFFSVTVEIRYIAEYDTQCFETKYIIYTKTIKKKKNTRKIPQNKQMKKKSIILIYILEFNEIEVSFLNVVYILYTLITRPLIRSLDMHPLLSKEAEKG